MESPTPGFGQNRSQRRQKRIWRQKEFRGNSVRAFPGAFYRLSSAGEGGASIKSFVSRSVARTQFYHSVAPMET